MRQTYFCHRFVRGGRKGRLMLCFYTSPPRATQSSRISVGNRPNQDQWCGGFVGDNSILSLSVCVFSDRPSVCLSLSVRPSICLSLFHCLSISVSLSVSICFSLSLSVSVCPSVCLSASVSVSFCLSMSLSVCLSFSVSYFFSFFCFLFLFPHNSVSKTPSYLLTSSSDVLT